MEIDIALLRNLLIAAAEMGAKRALIEVGEIRPFLSKSQAYKIYGRGTVDRWISECLIIPQKDGTTSSKIRLDRKRLEELSITSNRTTYLTTDERIRASFVAKK